MSARIWRKRRAGDFVKRLQQWGRRSGLNNVWWGPCLHDRIPWDRCDICGDLTEEEARALLPPVPLVGRSRLAERARKRREMVASREAPAYRYGCQCVRCAPAIRRRAKDYARAVLP